MFFLKDECSSAKPAFVASDPVYSLPALLAAAGNHLEDDDARVIYAFLKLQSEHRAFIRTLDAYAIGFENDEAFKKPNESARAAHRANLRLEVDFLLIGWQPTQNYPQ